jgi:hypothetical protein
MSSPHSVPRKFAETGLSFVASRNGFAAFAETASKIDVVIIAIGRGFTDAILATGRLTMHARIS